MTELGSFCVELLRNISCANDDEICVLTILCDVCAE